MSEWKSGDRVEHQTFGTGTVLECNDQHTTVHFDAHGRRKFASAIVALTKSTSPTPFAAASLPSVARAAPHDCGTRHNRHRLREHQPADRASCDSVRGESTWAEGLCPDVQAVRR
jgi:hypothetical protein